MRILSLLLLGGGVTMAFKGVYGLALLLLLGAVVAVLHTIIPDRPKPKK